MRKSGVKRLFAITMISFLLFWTAGPSIMLATFITPGTPIAPGTAIKPGDPISGGQFIAPGEVLTPGESFLPGQPGYGNIPSVSGQPIIPGTSITNGIFITPNYISTPYSGWQLGAPITGGQGPDGGQGGTGNGTGGTPGSGGQGGTGDAGSEGTVGSTTGEGQSGTGSTTGSESSIAGNMKSSLEFLKNSKKALVTIPSELGKVLDGSLSIYAGFKITEMKDGNAKSNRWKIEGNSRAVDSTGKISNWLNKRYSNYLNSFDNSKAVVKSGNATKVISYVNGKRTVTYDPNYIPRNSEFKQKRVQGFIDENISPKTIVKKTGSYFKKNWIPIDNGKFNSSFFNMSPKGPNLAKANGLANVVLSVGYRLAENAADPSRTGVDLAAGISTDVVIGAGTTALSAGTGWLAAASTAAAVGSVVPGIGTLVGAGVGLGIAVFMSTTPGRRFSKGIEKGIKSGIEFVGNAGKKLFSKFGWGT